MRQFSSRVKRHRQPVKSSLIFRQTPSCVLAECGATCCCVLAVSGLDLQYNHVFLQKRERLLLAREGSPTVVQAAIRTRAECSPNVWSYPAAQLFPISLERALRILSRRSVKSRTSVGALCLVCLDLPLMSSSKENCAKCLVRERIDVVAVRSRN